MSNWNPTQYLKYEKERTQPVWDLAMRISKLNPKRIIDLGCGPGNSTGVLSEVFKNASILGIDSSESMIKKAAENYPNINFKVCDVTEIKEKYDLIFSNACLQWIPNHDRLLPDLIDKLNVGGTLAVQMPYNNSEPLYQIIDETVNDPKWNIDKKKLQSNITLSPNEYYNILSKRCSGFDIWEVKYQHIMPNCDALIEWVKGTRLRPYLEYLGKEAGEEFKKEILSKSVKEYPAMPYGNIIFSFNRLFFTATK